MNDQLCTSQGVIAVTFGDLFMLYFERHAKLRNRCPRNAHYFFTAHGPHWRDVPAADITREQIQTWADSLASRSPSAATRGIGVMSAVFSWSIKREHFKGANPCLGVEKFATKSRKRFLAPHEFVRFSESLNKESPLIHDFFWICLATAARRGNVQAMRWDEIDFDMETWTIPEEKFKNSESHIVPLNKLAVDILKNRAEKSNGSPWVFPSTKRSATGHLMEPRRALERILARADIKDLHIHDLRRTLASYMAMQGENQYVIAQMLGHRDMRSTAVYARLDTNSVRKASENAIDKWQKILSGGFGKPLQIHELTKRAAENTETSNLSACEQVLMEAKIITAIREGGTTKKRFYQKIGSQVPFDKFDLERVLSDMVQRQLISQHQNDAGVTHYSLNEGKRR